MSQEDNKKHSLDILVYEYLLKNKFKKTAITFMGELGMTSIEIGGGPPSLSTWYNAFVETAEVRSGEKFIPESLNRIEGIMFKLENDKRRYSRMKSILAMERSLETRYQQAFDQDQSRLHRTDIQQSNIGSPFQDTQNAQKKHNSLPGPCTLSEIKRVDLGLPAITASCFCPQSSILIAHSSDYTIHFYNLATNEIECDFSTERTGLRMMKAIEDGGTIYLAYSCDGHDVNLCSYVHMKKDCICTIDSEMRIRDFCLSKDHVYVLDGRIRMFAHSGACMGMLECQNVVSIEWADGSFIVVKDSIILEYDIFLNGEIGTVAMGVGLSFKAKGDVAFVIQDESIQAIDIKTGFTVSSVRCTLPHKDLAVFSGTMAMCTSTDLFYANNVFPLNDAVELAKFRCLNHEGLLAVLSDGMVVLFSKAQTHE